MITLTLIVVFFALIIVGAPIAVALGWGTHEFTRMNQMEDRMNRMTS